MARANPRTPLVVGFPSGVSDRCVVAQPVRAVGLIRLRCGRRLRCHRRCLATLPRGCRGQRSKSGLLSLNLLRAAMFSKSARSGMGGHVVRSAASGGSSRIGHRESRKPRLPRCLVRTIGPDCGWAGGQVVVTWSYPFVRSGRGCLLTSCFGRLQARHYFGRFSGCKRRNAAGAGCALHAGILVRAWPGRLRVRSAGNWLRRTHGHSGAGSPHASKNGLRYHSPWSVKTRTCKRR